MYMTREQAKMVCEGEGYVVADLWLEDAINNTLRLAEALILEEANAIQKVEPHAFNSIQRLKMAADEIRFLAHEFENGDFREV